MKKRLDFPKDKNNKTKIILNIALDELKILNIVHGGIFHGFDEQKTYIFWLSVVFLLYGDLG